ncbi:MAG: CRISPR-associated helicase Cas3' [Thermoproteus sp.]
MSGDLRGLIVKLYEAWHRGRSGGAVGFKVDEERLRQQLKVAEEIMRSEDVVVLKAPTGFGKTEAWLAPFLNQWEVGEWFAPRMYVVEPVHALLRQMRDRVKASVSALGRGSITVDEDHGELLRPTYLYAGVITLTTVDSLVYGYLAQRVYRPWKGLKKGYYTFPAGLLATSYIVFDEAHLIQDDAYLGPRIFGKVICDLASAGAKVVVSTATVSSAFLKYVDCGYRELDLLQGRRDVEVVWREKKIDPSDIDCGGLSLVIVNTIPKARELYKQIRRRCGEDKAWIIHSLMRRQEREKALEMVKEAAKSRNGGVLVGTQAVEVGIDLDFGVLYTEVSPLDSLVQRVGRVGRRGAGRAYIFDVESEAPYIKELVNATRELLREDAARLADWQWVKLAIEEVYNEDVVKLLASRGDELYGEALAYLTELSSFSYPPKRELRLRPSCYVVVSIAETDGKAASRSSLEDGMIKFSLPVSMRSILRGAKKDGMIKLSCEDLENSDLCRFVKLIKDNIYMPVRSLDNDKMELRQVHIEDCRSVERYSMLVVPRSAVFDYYDEAGLKVELIRETVAGKKKSTTARRRRSKKVA